MVNGIFLYYPNAGYLERTQVALRGLDLPIEKIQVNRETVSNLVPGTLQDGAESWLILFHSDSSREGLILPFPDKNHFSERFQDSIDDLLLVIMEFRDRDFWYELLRTFFRQHGRFQYLRTDVPLNSLINPEQEPQQEAQEIRQTVRLFQETSQNIQQRRVGTLRKAQRENDFSVLGELDNVFSKAADKLFGNIGNIRSRRFEEVVPPIVYDFWDVMDGETMRFLITSETVTKFADKHSPSNFDYSAPGCGLWKAVERELNLSLVLHLRREAGIVKSVSMPWKSSENISGKFPVLTGENRSVDLSERESKRSENLKGMMLGDMQYMLELGRCNTVEVRLENLFSPGDSMLQYLLNQPSGAKDLSGHLEEIRRLRNGHAHINAMSREKFGELRNLILPSSRRSSSKTCLIKILQLKSKVLKYWENKGDCFTKSKMSVTTEEHKTIEFGLYNRMSVKPTTRGTMELVAKGVRGLPYCSIATFKKIEEANAALESLAQAADAGKSWNALEFKQNLETVSQY